MHFCQTEQVKSPLPGDQIQKNLCHYIFVFEKDSARVETSGEKLFCFEFFNGIQY